jgi:hypothetical protein
MTGQLTPAPRSEALGAAQKRRAGDADHANTLATSNYTASTPPRIPWHLCSHLVMWVLRREAAPVGMLPWAEVRA